VLDGEVGMIEGSIVLAARARMTLCPTVRPIPILLSLGC
jgi:hypothetical protein